MGINVTVTQQGVEDCCHCLLSCWLNLEHIHSRTHTATEDVMVEGIQCVCVLSSGRTAGGEGDSQGSSALMSLQNFFALHFTP